MEYEDKSLKKIRQSLGMTQAEAAAYVKMPLRTYLDYENKEARKGSLKYAYLVNALSSYGQKELSLDAAAISMLRQSKASYALLMEKDGRQYVLADDSSLKYLKGVERVISEDSLDLSSAKEFLRFAKRVYSRGGYASSLLESYSPILELHFKTFDFLCLRDSLVFDRRNLRLDEGYNYLGFLLSEECDVVFEATLRGHPFQRLSGSLAYSLPILASAIHSFASNHELKSIITLLCQLDFKGQNLINVEIEDNQIVIQGKFNDTPDDFLNTIFKGSGQAKIPFDSDIAYIRFDNEKDNENGVFKPLSNSKKVSITPKKIEIVEEQKPIFAKKEPVQPIDQPKEDDKEKELSFGPSIELNEKEKAIIKLIKKNPAITRSDLMQETGIAPATLSRIVKRLKDIGQLVRVGSDKAGYWELGPELSRLAL